jgi:hypothetical protein
MLAVEYRHRTRRCANLRAELRSKRGRKYKPRKIISNYWTCLLPYTVNFILHDIISFGETIWQSHRGSNVFLDLEEYSSQVPLVITYRVFPGSACCLGKCTPSSEQRMAARQAQCLLEWRITRYIILWFSVMPYSDLKRSSIWGMKYFFVKFSPENK